MVKIYFSNNLIKNKKEFKRKGTLAVLFLFLFISILIGRNTMRNNDLQVMLPVNEKLIIIDAGHGGFDPGKVGSDGNLNEKEINLAIVKKLQMHLEQGGARVYLTRDNDEALGENKNDDMKERKEITNTSDGDLLISIHQNAFTSSSVKGSQVFYNVSSEKGELLAIEIQNALNTYTDPSNERVAKANNDYYILKTTNIPSVLVECGFLSNPTEEKLLNDDNYQEKIAWGIYLGILEYYKNNEIL